MDNTSVNNPTMNKLILHYPSHLERRFDLYILYPFVIGAFSDSRTNSTRKRHPCFNNIADDDDERVDLNMVTICFELFKM